MPTDMMVIKTYETQINVEADYARILNTVLDSCVLYWKTMYIVPLKFC